MLLGFRNQGFSMFDTECCAHCVTTDGHTPCCMSCGVLQGKRLVFVTNNSTKSRAGYLGKFTGLGLKVNAVSSRGS